MKAPPEPRLALVELRATDPFSQYRTRLYGFFAGFAAAEGVPWRWLAVGFDRDAQPLGPFVVTLPAADLDALAGALREHEATHVICNERLAPDTRDELDARLARTGLTPAPAWHTMGEADIPGALDFAERVGALASWLGVEQVTPDAAGLVDAVAPRYEQDAVGRLRPAALVPILGGTNCLYQRPISRSPKLARLSGLPAHARFGCTFCGSRTTARYPYRQTR